MSTIAIPDNILANLFIAAFPENTFKDVKRIKSPELLTSLITGKCDFALIPTMELIKKPELVVSGNFGISLDGEISNSFYYFKSGQKSVNEIYLEGDISYQDVMLTKLIFKEIYGISPELKINTTGALPGENRVISGDENYRDDLLFDGLNMTGEVIEFLGYPFVNYVLTAKTEEKMSELEMSVSGKIREIYDILEDFQFPAIFSEQVIEYFDDMKNHIAFSFYEHHQEAIDNLIGFPFLLGMTEDVPDYKMTKLIKREEVEKPKTNEGETKN